MLTHRTIFLYTCSPGDAIVEVALNASSCGPRFQTVISLPWHLTFRPLSGVTGHRVTCVLPANFQLATPFRSRLGSGTWAAYGHIITYTHRQTEGQIDIHTDDGYKRLMPPIYGGGTSILYKSHSYTATGTGNGIEYAEWYWSRGWRVGIRPGCSGITTGSISDNPVRHQSL